MDKSKVNRYLLRFHYYDYEQIHQHSSIYRDLTKKIYPISHSLEYAHNFSDMEDAYIYYTTLYVQDLNFSVKKILPIKRAAIINASIS